MQTTGGTLLDGRVRYIQPAAGYRTGIEPVLLAASIPARPGQRVLEAGTGAGAALLCLCARVPGLVATGIERDPAMAGLARANAAANAAPITIQAADIADARFDTPFHHVFANPPWHDPASTRPASSRVDAAKHRVPGGIEAWIGAMAHLMAPRATLTLALPASLSGAAIGSLLSLRLGQLLLFPLWPRAGRSAKLVLLQARRGAGPSHVAPGLVLHAEGSGYTDAAEAVLRHAAPLGNLASLRR